ncbi:MAG: hypothetical protein M1165_00780 [Candidatus Pacearchaeota archaeon]|nr:hypothetical protein [Candidatus Pacearchaeota archaeon]MDE1848485.1 hypothetical protein [Nanoarchaeota archaeon]
MGLFNKNKKGASSANISSVPELPELPELPPLPKLPDMPASNVQKQKLNALPRIPPSSLGDKFSQNTIKDAVSGGKESDETNDSEEEVQTMPMFSSGPMTREINSDEEEEMPEEEPSMAPMTRSISSSEPSTKKIYAGRIQKEEPVFVRLDKFEENIEVFDKIKKQIAGVEKLLEEIKRTKEEESKELNSWQERLQTMKNQIERIDRDIFSKIE